MVDMPLAAPPHVREQILQQNLKDVHATEQVLRQNVRDLQLQLQESFRKIAELRSEITQLRGLLDENTSVDCDPQP